MNRDRVCPRQPHPLKFYGHLRWLDGQPILTVMEPYRQRIHSEALYTFRADGSPQYRRVLTGRAKKNWKTCDAAFAALYKLLGWQGAGVKGNQVYFVASDLGQANDDLDLTKKLVRCNPVLDAELLIKQNVIERKDGTGFIEILPAGDARGLHGKTYLFLVVDELHTQKDYRVLEALELDRTRPDATQWFASYASLYRQAGVPLVDLLKQHERKSDPRLYVSWYAGTVEEANPSLNQPLGPTTDDIEDARRALPSWIFRRLYQNLPGQPDGAAFDALTVEAAVIAGRTGLPPDQQMPRKGFVDMSGGGNDASVLAIAHSNAEGKAVLDQVLDQGPRGKTFSPQQAVARFADVLKQYGCYQVTGDRYAGEWPRQEFAAHGIVYELSSLSRSDLYAAFEPLLNSGQVELLDHPVLMQQLIGLVRSSGMGRNVKIDHPPGEHDDYANAAAGAVHLVKGGTRTPGIFLLDVPRMPDEHLFTRIG
jgi:hypothetical protein